MALDAYKNFAYSTVATAPSPAASGTSLVVAASDGAKFPTVPFNATIWPAGQQPTTTNAEVVRVTARGTDTLTITRTQESTSARTVLVGDQIAATWTGKLATDITAAISAAVGDVSYVEFTANVSVTATTEATANTVVTAAAVTFDGATAYIIEFFTPNVSHSAATSPLVFAIYDGAASIGMFTVHSAAAISAGSAVYGRRRLTPSAAAHTYSIRAFVGSGTGTVQAGAGGLGNNLPGYIRIARA